MNHKMRSSSLGTDSRVGSDFSVGRALRCAPLGIRDSIVKATRTSCLSDTFA